MDYMVHKKKNIIKKESEMYTTHVVQRTNLVWFKLAKKKVIC